MESTLDRQCPAISASERQTLKNKLRVIVGCGEAIERDTHNTNEARIQGRTMAREAKAIGEMLLGESLNA
jgi:hypothetical protein